jgi:hypothetical protein
MFSSRSFWILSLPKLEIYASELITQSKPIWADDLKKYTKNFYYFGSGLKFAIFVPKILVIVRA